jgi:hypothetical protein
MQVIRIHLWVGHKDEQKLLKLISELIASLSYRYETIVEITQTQAYRLIEGSDTWEPVNYIQVWSKREHRERLEELVHCLAPLGMDIHTGILEEAYHPVEAALLGQTAEPVAVG